MNEPLAINDVEAIAAEALSALDQCRQIAPFSDTRPSFDLGRAYAVTARLRELRRARGETWIGRKIGFTNRTIWPEYGVYAPIFGDMYDTTVRDLSAADARASIAHLPEPRIEPEIVFGLAAAPQAGMDEAQILECIGWIAHGFEIVQSIFPAWRFKAPDTVAGFGLHGALHIGSRHRIRPKSHEDWLKLLSRFQIALYRNGAEVDRGQAANVLGGPLSALRHLVELLAHDPNNPPVSVGEIVTTGTITRAFPVSAGEVWETEIIGLPLEGISIRLD